MNNYTKFTVQNFRCFSSKQTLKLAVPNKDKVGSGITYIVGPNNSGKTTLIESLNFTVGSSINNSDKRMGTDPEFKYYDDDTLITSLTLRKNSSELVNSDSHTNNSPSVISSRKHWQPSTTGHVTTHRTIKQSDNISNILQGITKNEDEYDSFTKYVKRVFPEFNEWKVGHENGQSYIEYIAHDKISHKSDLLGDGVIAVIRILVQLFNNSSSPLIIDEPELSLHPLAQKKLIKLIAEHAQNRQIIIATHSPYFIDWEYIKNGAALNRVVKESETNSRICTLQKYEEYEKLINGGNWQQPFLMDVVSKEIFFQDNILFVEGQEDVGLLQPQFKDTDINLFGYGVRGYDNFEVSLKLAKDLGIKKACCIIDSPDPTRVDLAKNENIIKAALEKEFSLNYKVIQWNKSDIRDKSAFDSPQKEGYYAKDGKLHPKEKLDDFDEKLKEVIEYFTS